MALSIGYETIRQWKESRGYFIDTEVFFPRGPRQMVLDLEPMHALLKSGATVELEPRDENGDYGCRARWPAPESGYGITTISQKAASLDAAVRDVCVIAIRQELVK